MKVELWFIGKTNEAYLREGIELYNIRLKRYLPFKMVIWPDVKKAKNLSPAQLKKQEGQNILQQLQGGDFLVLLDEKGRSFSSMKFAGWMEKQLGQSHRRLIFLVGGAFGFSEEIYNRAQMKLSLSEMTFSHQMIRLFFAEQLYRAMTILRNEPYHNE